jgi:threonine/homoserine/homoserine lactone efflux protein
MSDIVLHMPQIAAYMIYLVAVASPGPANIAIIGTAIHQGRKRAVVLALGIFAGSFTWAMGAALGLAAILTQYGQILQVLKVIGGLYMIYLAFKASRNALRASPVQNTTLNGANASLPRIFMAGYAIHITNPKAIFGWLATIAVGLPQGASPLAVAVIVGGCLATGFSIFLGYALLFSTARAARLYQGARRPLDALMALIFGAAGIKMVSSAL